MTGAALILLCAINIAPTDCTPVTATDVIAVRLDGDLSCAQPQQILASLAIEAGEGHYWLIRCPR